MKKFKYIFVTKGHCPPRNIGAKHIPSDTVETDKIGPFVDALSDVLKANPDIKSESVIFVEWLGINDKSRWINNFCKQKGLSSDETLIIDIHFDVASEKFIAETPLYGGIYYGSSKGLEVANSVKAEISSTLDSSSKLAFWIWPQTKHRDGSIGIIRLTTPISILIECGFVAGPISKSSHVFVGLVNFITKNLE